MKFHKNYCGFLSGPEWVKINQYQKFTNKTINNNNHCLKQFDWFPTCNKPINLHIIDCMQYLTNTLGRIFILIRFTKYKAD